jgi:hypothetical protein
MVLRVVLQNFVPYLMQYEGLDFNDANVAPLTTCRLNVNGHSISTSLTN